MNRKRSNFEVMMRLIGLVKPLTGYMILAICMGLTGHLCAAALTVLAGYGILHIIGLYDGVLVVIFLIMGCMCTGERYSALCGAGVQSFHRL